jgi:hypothetical protein
MAYKARPITSKACSPYKSDANLIEGARNMADSKKFKDHSEGLEEKFDAEPGEGPVDHGKTQKEDEEKFKHIETDSTKTPKV